MLTSVSETTYPTSNTSTASVYSVGGGVLDAPSTTASDALAKSLLGNNCKKVDLFSASLVKGRGTVEDGGGILSSESNISMNSTTNSSTLFSMEVDAIGNMTKFNGYDFNWNGRRLESISQDGVELISYKYNIDGQRVSKTVGNTTTEYFYNGDILAGQKTGNDVLIFMYDNNGDVFGFTYNGTPYYYIKNAQNDVYMIVDETGVAQVLYMYDAWGRIGCYDATNFGLATINPLMYRSYYLDVETGYHFYYLNSRYYLADLGRFISADTTDILSVQSDLYDKNLFAYCDNNPVHRVDTTGFVWETVFDIASLCLSMAEVAVNPADAWAWIGLAADFVDLVPFVTGLGEVVRAVKVSNKAIDAVDTVSDAKKIINSVDNTKDALKSTKVVHGNSLKTTKETVGYALRKNGTDEIMKFGETTRGVKRYTQKFYLDNNVYMDIMTRGSKYDMHYWQHNQILGFYNDFGVKPPLNKSFW